jgi:thiosulfate/3-mercaptopyruvate sulfurtransferase
MYRPLRRLVLSLIGWGLAGALWAAQPLLTPQELHARLDHPELRVIDIRDSKTYEQGHVPGALSAPYVVWRGPVSNPGALPPLDKLHALVHNLGLSPQTPVVVVSQGVDANDFGAAARVYWTLKLLGLRELSVLNGGAQAWVQAGLPLDTQEAMVDTSDYKPALDTTWLATTQDIQQRLGQADRLLVDARPPAYFLGQTRVPAVRVAGTMPGAVGLPSEAWLEPDSGRFLAPDLVRQRAAGQPLLRDKELVSFCNSGHFAATNWFAMSEVLGRPHVKLYAGSMIEWTQAPQALPMDHVPGRLRQLMMDAQLWTDKTFR